MATAVFGVHAACSGDWIDTFDPRGQAHRRYALDRLDDFAADAAGTQVIFEASGGYDRPLARALDAAGVPNAGDFEH